MAGNVTKPNTRRVFQAISSLVDTFDCGIRRCRSER
jgi:hypothetical protein